MKEIESGTIHVDDNGNMHYVSDSTIGGGLAALVLFILSTVFVTEVSVFLNSNKWIVLIPTLIAVMIRTVIFDKRMPIYKRGLNILFDAIKTVCMYGVLLIVLDKIATAHWLDRVFFAVLFGALLLGVYYVLSKFVFNMLRTCQLCALHILACLVVAAISLCLYFGHTWYWMGYVYNLFQCCFHSKS